MAKLWSLMKKAGLNGFFLALLGMILLAYLVPQFGTKDSVVPLSTIANYGVSLIFFFYGLRLSPEKLKSGLSNWRLHLVIQSTTFMVFPLVVLGLNTAFAGAEPSDWWLGVFYLAALPSTVSSSVVMVSIAGGNLAAAIFNASISSVIGIFITPLWMGWFMQQSSFSMDLSGVIIDLMFKLLLPVILGLIMHHWWGTFAEKHKNELRLFDQTVILLIIYTAFSESFAGNMFSGYTIGELFLLGILMLSFFLVMLGIMHLISVALHFRREDRITVIFCGSKKSLVQGAVMGKVMFPDPAVFGVILLPLMLYHALQLVFGSAIAQRMSLKSKAAIGDLPRR
jgi:sodium/bile acid cotransporter 7